MSTYTKVVIIILVIIVVVFLVAMNITDAALLP
jgi:hypothetical protein